MLAWVENTIVDIVLIANISQQNLEKLIMFYFQTTIAMIH